MKKKHYFFIIIYLFFIYYCLQERNWSSSSLCAAWSRILVTKLNRKVWWKKKSTNRLLCIFVFCISNDFVVLLSFHQHFISSVICQDKSLNTWFQPEVGSQTCQCQSITQITLHHRFTFNDFCSYAICSWIWNQYINITSFSHFEFRRWK